MKKINLGLIGCGYWGPNLVRNFSSLPECEVKYVCDLKEDRLDFIKHEFPFLRTTTDYNDILNDKNIDAVAIATHVSTHSKIAVDSINAGKHVFVEKPLAHNVKEAKAIVDISKEKDKLLVVGHVFQYAPAVRRIKELLKEKAIGDILHISSTRINMGPPNTEVDVIWDLAPHDFSIILYLLDDYPVELKCRRDSYPFSFLTDRNISLNKLTNNAHIDLKFKNNITSHIHISWLSANKIRFMQIFGTEGTIVYDEMLALDGKLKLYGKGEDNRVNGNNLNKSKLMYSPGEIRIIQLEQHEPLRMECEEFINAIINKYKPVNDGEIGLRVVRLIEETLNCN